MLRTEATFEKDGVTQEVFHVDVPLDFGDDDERKEGAIFQAREECDTYRVPCNWVATLTAGERVVVVRTSYVIP